MSFKVLYRSLSITLFTLIPAVALANFDFNANCLKAYQNIFDLKLNTARQLINAEKKIRPNNAIIPLLENYVDYFYLLTNESKTEFERLEANKAARLNKISNDDKSSPYYLYAQAEINLQWALIRGRYGSYYAAAREINKASSLLKENQSKFPNFVLNMKGIGLINVVIGSLPDGFMKSALATFGVKGNVQTGLNQLDKLADNLLKSPYEPFYEEVIFYYAYLLSDVVKASNAYAKTIKLTSKVGDSSLLKTYMEGYVSVRNGKNDEAISILENRPRGGAYQSFPYLEYLLGVARLNKLDYGASSNFINFLEINKGVNYIKDTYWHLALIGLLKNDSVSFSSYASKSKSKGATFNEKDKQALSEANGATPNVVLLKARLLSDGGYLTKAAAVLASSKADDFKTVKDRSEYYYRLGRINSGLGKPNLAISNYNNAIAAGKGSKFYYAAKSAVLAGKIFEDAKNVSLAKSYYNQAIAMKDYEYKNSIDNEAKVGLKRIGS